MTIDNRRWDTGQILAGGILDIIPPPVVAPKIEYADGGEDGATTDNARREALQSGKGLAGCQYYGVWSIWPDGDAFSGELRQYRAVTDSFTKEPIDRAVEKAGEWFAACWG